MNKKQLRFGIIGAGNIALKHAKAIQACPSAHLVAVHSHNPDRCNSFAVAHEAEAETDLEKLLARADIDAVTIATPSGAHLEACLAAARAGKHILCEKPLEITVDRADQIIQACQENGVKLACAFQARLSGAVQRLQKSIAQGRFGKPLLCSVQMRWFRSQEYYQSGRWRGTWALDGGGALMNQGIHVLDLLRLFAGPPVEVTAITDCLSHYDIEVEDTAVAIVRFANGAMGTIEASTSCAPGFPRRLEYSGTRGSATLEDDRLVRWSFVDKTEDDDCIAASGSKGDKPKSGASDPMQISHKGHLRLIDDLALAVHENRPPAVPGEEARHVIELIEGIYESARTKRPYVFARASTADAS